MNLQWELKTTDRKRKSLSLVIGSKANGGLKTYPCNRWGYGYWLWRMKNGKMARWQGFKHSQGS